MPFSASFLISAGIVALNSAVWRPEGQRDRIISTSSRKPRSSISSASSSTTKRAAVSISECRLIRSITRPTVPTTTCAPSFSCACCERIGAAAHRHDPHTFRGTVRPQRLRHLDAQLARRGEDERLHLVVVDVDVLEQREAERGGLAGAGLRLADHVATLEQSGDRLLLDRRGILVAEVTKGVELGLGQPELSESCHCGASGYRGVHYQLAARAAREKVLVRARDL